jgi:signal transduction histidine kinase
VATGLFLIFIAAFALRGVQLPVRPDFASITSVILVMTDLIIATLLFAEARVLQARPLAALAAGFFLAGLLVTLRFLALPGGPHSNIPLWFYLASHAALPLAILSYAWPDRTTHEAAWTAPHGHWLAGQYLLASIILAWGLTSAVVATETSLPWTSSILLTALLVLLLIVAAMILVWRRLASELDLWLLLMLWGWYLETLLIAMPTPVLGFTLGWYAARCLGLVSALFVLFALLAETSKLYAQSVLQLIAQAQEREHRFLIRDVLSASIAHELRQPLAAILINAQTARKFAFGESAIPPEETKQTLDEIVASCLRANDILESTRAMFGRGSSERTLVDPALVLRRTLGMVASGARAQRVSTDLVVEGRPGPIAINPLQFQQALLNLLQNAIEALSHSDERRRTLLVRCSCWEDRGVVIRVEDNGPGIAPADRNRIFDAFFTTRPEGTGMGLVIARSVIRAHGGRLDVEPQSPSGTAFVIHLPFGE